MSSLTRKTYANRQRQWVEENGIKAGDTVLVTKEFASGEDGWDNSWVSEMFAGQKLEVTSWGDHGVNLSNGCGYPFQVLKKIKAVEVVDTHIPVSEDYNATVRKDGVRVGSQTFPKWAVKEAARGRISALKKYTHHNVKKVSNEEFKVGCQYVKYQTVKNLVNRYYAK